jgi:hypothetical protein
MLSSLPALNGGHERVDVLRRTSQDYSPVCPFAML